MIDSIVPILNRWIVSVVGGVSMAPVTPAGMKAVVLGITFSKSGGGGGTLTLQLGAATTIHFGEYPGGQPAQADLGGNVGLYVSDTGFSPILATGGDFTGSMSGRFAKA